jgi:transcriptional regulator with XRE-family HTH domain
MEEQFQGVPGLKPIRQLCKVSRASLATALGLSPVQIGNYENGLSKPGLSGLQKLCTFFGCEPNDLMIAPTDQRCRQIASQWFRSVADAIAVNE